MTVVRGPGSGGTGVVGSEGSEGFDASLRRRGDAAEGLERDLLTEVPMLYGSPGKLEAEGDPGVVLARIHREELLRRNGGGILSAPSNRSGSLPYERATGALAVLLLLLIFLA